jgi:hypothetical protein
LAIFEITVPIAAREKVLRLIMLNHRERTNFWVSKNSVHGRTRRQLAMALPHWTAENRIKAVEIWFSIRFGESAWNELKNEIHAAARAESGAIPENSGLGEQLALSFSKNAQIWQKLRA